jgi:hypothetical protein
MHTHHLAAPLLAAGSGRSSALRRSSLRQRCAQQRAQTTPSTWPRCACCWRWKTRRAQHSWPPRRRPRPGAFVGAWRWRDVHTCGRGSSPAVCPLRAHVAQDCCHRQHLVAEPPGRLGSGGGGRGRRAAHPRARPPAARRQRGRALCSCASGTRGSSCARARAPLPHAGAQRRQRSAVWAARLPRLQQVRRAHPVAAVCVCVCVRPGCGAARTLTPCAGPGCVAARTWVSCSAYCSASGSHLCFTAASQDGGQWRLNTRAVQQVGRQR